MGKIRSKNLKPKTGSDFKKTKAKVGRKIKSSTETKIVVKSKDVVLRNQSIENEKTGSEKETIERILKQFNHYSTSNRSIALGDFKKLMESSGKAESYIAMILPDAMVLLHDIEQQPRKDCVEVLTALFARFPTLSFQAVSPIIITYICSGLTNLHKGVRKDALLTLSSLAQHHPRLLLSSSNKIVEYVLVLLADPSQAGGQDSLASSSKSHDETKSGNGGTGREGGKREPKKKSAVLTIILNVLRKIVTSSPSDGGGGNTDTTKTPTLVYNAVDSSGNGILVLRRRPHTNLLTEYKRRTGGSVNERDIGPAYGLPLPLLVKLCCTLKSVWSGLLIAENNSMVAIETAEVLSEICAIAHSLGTSYCASDVKEYRGLVAAIFAHFPHTSLEASVSASNSDAARRGRLAIDLLDLCICDIALQSGGGAAAAQTAARSHLVWRVEEYVDGLDKAALQHPRGGGPGEDSSIVTSLFGCLQAMALSDEQGEALPTIFASVQKVLRRQSSVQVQADQKARSIVGCALRCAANVVTDTRFWTLPAHAAALPFVADVLCSGIPLTVSCRCELGYLTASLTRAALSFLQVCSSSDDRMTSLAVARVSECALELFRDVKKNRVAATGDASAYHLSDSSVRYTLLDIFFYSKFEGFADAARVVIKCIAKSSTDRSEQRYFLKILYESRFNLALQDFIDLLVYSLSCNARSAFSSGAAARFLRKEAVDGVARDAALCKCIEASNSAAFSSGVAEVLVWCSSPENPSNIARYMLPIITGFASETPSNASHWAEAFVRVLAALTVLHELLLPCLDGASIEDALLQEILDTLMQLASRLLIDGIIVPLALMTQHLYGPLFAVLSLAVDKTSRSPVVFCCLLRQLMLKWPALAVAEQERALQAVLFVVSQPDFTALNNCKGDIKGFADSIGSSCHSNAIERFFNFLL